VAQAGVDAGSELGSGPDPLVAVKGSLAVAEAGMHSIQDIVEVVEEGVVVGVCAEVDLSEGVGGKEGRGLLVEVLLEHGGKKVCVEMQEIPVEFVGGHCGVGPKLGRSGESETSTQKVRAVYWL